MMTAQDKERYDTLINTIDESLTILRNDYNTAFVLTLLTNTEDKNNAIAHAGCDCTVIEALVMLEDLSEKYRNMAKAIGMVAVLTDRKNN